MPRQSSKPHPPCDLSQSIGNKLCSAHSKEGLGPGKEGIKTYFRKSFSKAKLSNNSSTFMGRFTYLRSTKMNVEVSGQCDSAGVLPESTFYFFSDYFYRYAGSNNLPCLNCSYYLTIDVIMILYCPFNSLITPTTNSSNSLFHIITLEVQKEKIIYLEP